MTLFMAVYVRVAVRAGFSILFVVDCLPSVYSWFGKDRQRDSVWKVGLYAQNLCLKTASSSNSWRRRAFAREQQQVILFVCFLRTR
jgi:hypothetical protein